ncbi:hypothetical protein KTR10_02875 [Candidatus Kaiserbacteria bacterium]|nr:hypothetical protein [Candidatus Kaiserbacteria bacterium]
MMKIFSEVIIVAMGVTAFFLLLLALLQQEVTHEGFVFAVEMALTFSVGWALIYGLKREDLD